jgi:hypothetical protein
VVRGAFDRGDRWPLLLIALGSGAVCSILLGRVSLHHLNRMQLSRCFCVKRPAGGGAAIRVPAADRDLSSLRPPPGDRSSQSFPRLLICATVNVNDRNPSEPGWTRYQPFIFTPERCGIPTEPSSCFETKKLEGARRGVGISVEPLLTLMSAVACAGAAVSPSMGRMTITGLRSVWALANLRLGTWLPNPHCKRIRREVEGRSSWWWRRRHIWQLRRHLALGSGYDEFVPELFGLQREDAPRAYMSDGGHYDNLGLLTLLRARCKTIWCVDSQADRRGKAHQLCSTIELAQREGVISHVTRDGSDLGLYDVFAPASGAKGAGHAVYEVTYDGGGTCALIVIKLGLTPQSSSALVDFSRNDRWRGGKFPYDQTFVRIAFSDERVEMYRHLGYENAERAVDAVEPST